MQAKQPTVLILHGDDDYSIDQYLLRLADRLGEKTTAEMNITRLDGRQFSISQLDFEVRALPFLAEKRIIQLTDPLGQLKSPKMREQLKSVMELVPGTTLLAIIIKRPLVSYRDRRSGKQHWLEIWADQSAGLGMVKEFSIPRGQAMVNWIRERANKAGGEFSHQAAQSLAYHLGTDLRSADKEIEKLLAYANYSRPVMEDDVEALTISSTQGNVFEMVDALGNRNGKMASRSLQLLLEQDDPLSLFGMIVRQFRLLVLTRELVDEGKKEPAIAKQLKVFPFVARKLIGQVRHFTQPSLTDIYSRLLDIDIGIKTGKLEGDIALHTFIAELT